MGSGLPTWCADYLPCLVGLTVINLGALPEYATVRNIHYIIRGLQHKHDTTKIVTLLLLDY